MIFSLIFSLLFILNSYYSLDLNLDLALSTLQAVCKQSDYYMAITMPGYKT
jgi:hypothetical protein